MLLCLGAKSASTESTSSCAEASCSKSAIKSTGSESRARSRLPYHPKTSGRGSAGLSRLGGSKAGRRLLSSPKSESSSCRLRVEPCILWLYNRCAYRRETVIICILYWIHRRGLSKRYRLRRRLTEGEIHTFCKLDVGCVGAALV